MLVLSRKANEKVLFPTLGAAVQVVSIGRGVVRLGIEAPPDVAVLRAELVGEGGMGHPDGVVAGGLSGEVVCLLRDRLHAAEATLALLREQQGRGLLQDSDGILERLEQEIKALRRPLEGWGDQTSSSPPVRPARRKALLVADDTVQRELLAGFLRLAGLEVATAGDGLDALDYLQKGEKPDVVLLDMGLPRCDGPTTIREIRRNPACADLKVFAVSASAPEQFGWAGAEGGVNRWFQKPVNPQELLRELEQELAGVA